MRAIELTLTEKLDKNKHKMVILEDENKTLQSQLHTQKTVEMGVFEKELYDKNSKYHRLEVEYNMLQRELSKKEIRCRGLQRDVMRLQVSE